MESSGLTWRPSLVAEGTSRACRRTRGATFGLAQAVAWSALGEFRRQPPISCSGIRTSPGRSLRASGRQLDSDGRRKVVKRALRRLEERDALGAPGVNLQARGESPSGCRDRVLQEPSPSANPSPCTSGPSPSQEGTGPSDAGAKERPHLISDSPAVTTPGPVSREREGSSRPPAARGGPKEAPARAAAQREGRPPRGGGGRGAGGRGPAARPLVRLGRLFDDLTAFVVPREKGDTRDVVLVCLSFGVLVYISQNLVKAYLSMLHVTRHM